MEEYYTLCYLCTEKMRGRCVLAEVGAVNEGEMFFDSHRGSHQQSVEVETVAKILQNGRH